jgi:hypothetical protein
MLHRVLKECLAYWPLMASTLWIRQQEAWSAKAAALLVGLVTLLTDQAGGGFSQDDKGNCISFLKKAEEFAVWKPAQSAGWLGGWTESIFSGRTLAVCFGAVD